MSFLYRVARPTRPVGRAYSSFFSSKPGGGRHFVSAKSPKPILQPKPGSGSTTANAQQPAANTTTTTTTTTTNPPGNTTTAKAASADENLTTKPVESPQSSHSIPAPSIAYPFNRPPIHPTLSSKDFKLHQFFSSHRPLLLLSQPISAIFETTDPSAEFLIPAEDHVGSDPRAALDTLDNPPESSPDADADAARQLAHTLVMNRVAGAVAWQQALSHLGLNAKYSENDMTLAKETAQEWVTVYADSTRRKKRKKMKKHKLKKRRRLTRRQNK